MSVPSRIGIHVPYTWDAATSMACTVADVAMRLGLPVSLFSNQAHDEGVHYRWDQNVLDGRRTAFFPWLAKCSHVVWFDVQKSKLREAKKAGCKNILVALWRRLSNRDGLELFDDIVCPHRAAFNWLRGQKTHKLTLAPWDPGISLTDEPMWFGGSRILVVVGGDAGEVYGPMLLGALRVLLDGNSKVMVTLAHTRRWNPVAFHLLKDIERVHGRRLGIIRKPGFSERMEAYATHDWVFDFDPETDSCLATMEAMCSGRPPIVFAVPPYDEVAAGNNALLIPCEIRYNQERLPQPILNAHEILLGMKTAVEEPMMHRRLRREVHKGWPKRRDVFQRVWGTLWNCG